MKVLKSLFSQESKQQPVLRFTPRIEIHPKSTLYIEVEPHDPTTTSNIIITAFASQQVRSIIPIRVEWSRFKVKAESPHATEKIHCLAGNTYMCEPGDVGGYIKAVVRSVDESIRADAEVVVGPIGIDVMVKRVIDGALYAGSLLSQVVVCERSRKNNVTIRLYNRTIEFTDDASQEKLVKEYSISEPKLELNPKDPTRVYLRFEQDQNNTVRQWLNRIFNIEDQSAEQSSLSIRVPYSTHSSNSSKMRLFQKSQGPCPNKFELRFISRLSRDLFLFTQRAFVCRQDMKNSVYIQRLETLQNLATEQDYHKFLEYMSLKLEIVRVAEYAKEVEEDRDAKVRDLTAMEESIGEMTLTYLKIIEEKGKQEKIDFEHSYSQINNTREDILNRKQFRELKAENEGLKVRLRQLNEEIDLLKFFKKDDNESMILNQTSNPFAKKPNDSMATPGGSPDRSNLKSMHELSLNYANLLEQNRVLKSENRQLKGDAMGKKRTTLDRSQNMIELLGSLDEREEREAREAKFLEYEQVIGNITKENNELRKRLSEMSQKKGVALTKQSRYAPQEEPSFLNNQTLINQSINSNASSSFLNCSITSDAAILKLEENLEHLSKLNQKLQEESARLRKERDYYRAEFMKMKDYIKEFQSNDQFADSKMESQLLAKYRQQNEQLQNEKKALTRKLESITKENTQGLKEEYQLLQKKIKQLELNIEKLNQENKRLSKEKQSRVLPQDMEALSTQNSKIKKINLKLMEQVKILKVELEKRKDEDMYNSRVIELQNELAQARDNTPFDSKPAAMMEKLNELSKQNARLKQQNEDQALKLKHQTETIQRLVGQHKIYSPQGKASSQTNSSKQKCYSEKCSQSTIQQLEKCRREIKKLQEEIIFVKKNSDVLDRSRQFNISSREYFQDRLEIMEKERNALYLQIENLSKMCERYGKDAREANKQLAKCKEKIITMMHSKHEDSSLLLND